jgi:hypothetical protein
MKNMSNAKNSERPPPEGCGAGFPTGKCLPELGEIRKPIWINARALANAQN